MKTGVEQENILRRLLADIFDPTGNLPDALDLSSLFKDQSSREEAARTLNQQAERSRRELHGGWFGGVITETELRNVKTGGDLLGLVTRHVNGELEDDTWSAL